MSIIEVINVVEFRKAFIVECCRIIIGDNIITPDLSLAGNSIMFFGNNIIGIGRVDICYLWRAGERTVIQNNTAYCIYRKVYITIIINTINTKIRINNQSTSGNTGVAG